MKLNIPVIELAKRLNVFEIQAHTALDIINDVMPLDNFDSVQKRKAECFNPPGKIDLKMTALNAILEGFGVEYIAAKDDTFCTKGIDYVNFGDTYANTICFDHDTGKWLVTSWGDVVEDNEGKYE